MSLKTFIIQTLTMRENVQAAKKGHRRKLKPLDEFFIVLFRLRRGFSEKHLARRETIALCPCLSQFDVFATKVVHFTLCVLQPLH